MSYEQISAEIAALNKRLDCVEAAQRIRLKLLRMKSSLLAAYQRRLFAYRWN